MCSSGKQYYISANEFFALAGRYQTSKRHLKPLTAYFLRNACECYCRAVIKHVLGIELPTKVSLWRLLYLTRWASKKLYSVFDFSMEKDRQIVQTLELGYFSPLGNYNYTLPFELILETRRRVQDIRKVAITLLEPNHTPAQVSASALDK